MPCRENPGEREIFQEIYPPVSMLLLVVNKTLRHQEHCKLVETFIDKHGMFKKVYLLLQSQNYEANCNTDLVHLLSEGLT